MKTIELGRTSERVSQLALGCMNMGSLTDEATSFAILDRYVEAGGTFLDTANCYAWWNERGSLGGHSESLLGRWFARTGRRDEVFLATKVGAQMRDIDLMWGDGDQPRFEYMDRNFDGTAPETLRRSIDESLRRLRTDHVDLLYVHVDDRTTPLEETLEALAEIVAAGKARYLGWSNVRTWRMERIRQLCDRYGWPAPVALQQQHSYLRRRAGLVHASIVDDEQLDYLREHDDLTLVAYSPLLKGVYTGPAKRAGHFAMEPYLGPDSEARLATLEAVAAEVGATPNQVVLAWLMAQTSPIVAPLVGPRTLEQYEENVAGLDVKLEPEHLERLDAAGA